MYQIWKIYCGVFLVFLNLENSTICQPVELDPQTDPNQSLSLSGATNDDVGPQDAEILSNFKGYRVYRLQANSTKAFEALVKLHDEGDLDFWQAPSFRGETDIMVNGNQEKELKDFMGFYKIDNSVLIDDLDSLMNGQRLGRLKSDGKAMSWTEYHYMETIFDWLDGLATFYPELVTLHSIGTTTDGNPLKLVKISVGRKDRHKPGIYIDALYHGREWISAAVATWIINELVTAPSRYSTLLKHFDFYIVPIMNPDGYAHSCSYNRLWRKSRKTSGTWADFLGCRGVDLNRNFGFHFGGPGSGTIPCSLIYRGTHAFSEPETSAVRDFIYENRNVKWAAYFALHSYGQKWMTPWYVIRVARIGIAAIESHRGTKFDVGSAPEVLYMASGGSDDWFKGAVGCKYSYTIELPDYGFYGFLLPSWEIIPTANETWFGISTALRSIARQRSFL
ncbi:Carboxypeptidase B [Orchesella cincta]|uniref:Carboxypeptidase B n=1 Tax=Orchesella cincta TaxID=48709 RepID=A0A1D2MQM2_ORCCI|nr:Carboxypeptidase B [Orchesella cincta]